MVECVLAARISVKLSPRVLHFDLKLAPRSVPRPLEVQVFQEVSSSRAFQSLVTSACPDKHADRSDRAATHVFSADTDAVLGHCHLEGSVELKGSRDLTADQVAKVL